MDGSRFDDLTKRLAGGASRRQAIKGLAGGAAAGVAALLGRSDADARPVRQAGCGNMVCADDPGVCNDGCVCCEFGNGNSRCMPPRDCQRHRGEMMMICTGQANCMSCHGDQCEESGSAGLVCAREQSVFACCPDASSPDFPEPAPTRGCCTPGVDCPISTDKQLCGVSACDIG